MSAEYEYDHNAMLRNGPSHDDGLIIQFFIHPYLQHDKSEAEGRPIYEDTEYIRIVIPGDRNNQPERPATAFDKRRFAKQYAAFKLDQDNEVIEGTMLEAWPIVTRSQVEELRYFKIRTVEHVANISDTTCQKIPGLTQLKQKANAWLAATKDTKAAEALAAELAKRDSQLMSLQETVKDLQAQVQAQPKR